MLSLFTGYRAIHPSHVYPAPYPAQFFCPFYFHFAHFLQKWINVRKNASTPRTGGSLFSGIVEFRALNWERTAAARAYCDLSFCFSNTLSPSCYPSHSLIVLVTPATADCYAPPLSRLLSPVCQRIVKTALSPCFIFSLRNGFHGRLGQSFAVENNKRVKRRIGRRIR